MIQRLQQKRNEEGFTLIELLIVIIVLGILAAIVVFAIGTTRKDSLASSCKTNLKAVELSAEAVKTKSGAYPTGTFSAVASSDASAAAASNANLLAGGTNGALLKDFPKSTDYALVYTSADGTAYSVAVWDADTSSAADGSGALAGCDALT